MSNDGGYKHRPGSRNAPPTSGEMPAYLPGGGVEADREWARSRIASFFRGAQSPTQLTRKPMSGAPQPGADAQVSQTREPAEQEADAVADHVSEGLHGSGEDKGESEAKDGDSDPAREGRGNPGGWIAADGSILEWDSRHGTVEKYNKRGKHLGEFDPNSGAQLKPADKTRAIEP